jgi:hypothetical protein
MSIQNEVKNECQKSFRNRDLDVKENMHQELKSHLVDGKTRCFAAEYLIERQ